jgi:hypothetical protein
MFICSVLAEFQIGYIYDRGKKKSIDRLENLFQEFAEAEIATVVKKSRW